MDRCLCKGQTFHEYLDDDKKILGVNCTSCGQEWLKETTQTTKKIIFKGQELGKYTYKECVDSGFLMTRPERTRITPENVRSLRKGDHITWHRTYGIWHHAIVVKTFSSGQIEVCHFASDKTRLKAKAIIKNKVMGPLEENGDLYRINYSNIPDENSADLVVARTKVFRFLSTIGEYCFFMKNCENFATFCKTGFIIRDQLEWLISQVKQSMHLGIGLQYAHCFPYEGIAALTGGENSVGAFLLVLGEIQMYSVDIDEINSNEGISKKDQILEQIQRLSACVGGAALGATGSYALGQLIGSTVGSQIGGPSGYFVGKMIGTWLGGRIGKYIEI